MTTWATGLGTALATLLLATFPVTMAVLPDTPDLRVTATSSDPFVVRESAVASIPATLIEPEPPPAGLGVADTSLGPGLDLRTWEVTYSHRWDRAVTLPILTGPFVHEGEEVCGLSVAIGAGLFDTAGGGKGFSSMLKQQLSAAFPREEHDKSYPITIRFPGVSDALVSFRLGNGGVGVFADVRLLDGTRFVIFVPVSVVARDGAPALVLKSDRLFTRWSGPTYDDLLRQARALGAAYYGHPTAAALCPLDIFDWFCPSESEREQIAADEAETKGQQMAHDQIADRITSAFDGLNLGFARIRGPHHPFLGNPAASVSLRLNGAPTVSAKGIALRLCASGQIAKKITSAVPGSARVGASVPVTPALPSGDSSIEVTADGDALNQLLYLLWQSGGLRALGTSQGLVQAALDRTRDPDGSESALQKLAFEFKGFDPGLPPTLTAGSGDSIGLAVGDVRIGDWDGRRVVAHATGTLALDTSGEKIAMTTTISQLTANCTAASGRATLTPCVSDLMPTVRDSLVGRQVHADIPGGDLLAKLPSMSFGGARLQLRGLRAATSGSPVRVSLKVAAAIVGDAP